MPLVTIEARRSWEPERRLAILEAVLEALRRALHLPAHDGTARFVQHAPEDFVVPAGATEQYLLIQIDLFSGRSANAKRTLYRGIFDNLLELGITGTDVLVLLRESEQENWGIRGGVPASDVDLGFRVDV